jgi:murein DD-endopeptidase MepM/ murein hydrolase activator NlpD
VTTAPVTTAPNTLPTFVAPAVGTVAKEHDLSVPVFSLTTNDWRTHTGIDIACAMGDAVYAAAAGTVTTVASDPMMGTSVTIAHSGDGVTVYRNLSVELAEGIKEGAKVVAGQVIGTVGDTAMIESADEPHLHFEMRVSGVEVDPLEYISEESKKASLTVDGGYES